MKPGDIYSIETSRHASWSQTTVWEDHDMNDLTVLGELETGDVVFCIESHPTHEMMLVITKFGMGWINTP